MKNDPWTAERKDRNKNMKDLLILLLNTKNSWITIGLKEVQAMTFTVT